MIISEYEFFYLRLHYQGQQIKTEGRLASMSSLFNWVPRNPLQEEIAHNADIWCWRSSRRTLSGIMCESGCVYRGVWWQGESILFICKYKCLGRVPLAGPRWESPQYISSTCKDDKACLARDWPCMEAYSLGLVWGHSKWPIPNINSLFACTQPWMWKPRTNGTKLLYRVFTKNIQTKWDIRQAKYMLMW